MTIDVDADVRGTREIDHALARSILYEALALGFRPPGTETCERLLSRQQVHALGAAAATVDPQRKAGLARAALRLAAPSNGGRNLSESLATSYARLFGHTTRGSVSAYETEYGQDIPFQQPQQLSDLSGFLRAFGLQLDTSDHERIDHVSVECEFMAFLARKEAYALERSDEKMLQSTCHAAKLFLRDHLGRFAPAFGRLVTREDPRGFYGALGDLCQRFVSVECARAAVPAGPEFLPLRDPTEDTTPMACGSANDLIQIGGGPAGEELSDNP